MRLKYRIYAQFGQETLQAVESMPTYYPSASVTPYLQGQVINGYALAYSDLEILDQYHKKGD